MLIALLAFGEPNPDKGAFYGEPITHPSRENNNCMSTLVAVGYNEPYSPTQSEQDDETDCPLVCYDLRIKRLDFRSALVIEKSDVFRRSIVQHLRTGDGLYTE